ncbi:MAG: trypsin-like peptidase domain-containing protein [Chloroflexi bacterium]|nr:trypsin-like peptidase domain-containing protein [Chloroflexota bacterium]
MAIVATPLLEQASAEVAALAAQVQPSLVLVQTPGGGSGSGIIWSADGLIVTNHHVVPHGQAEVVLQEGRRLPAAVAFRDPRRDLAALRVPAQGLAPATFGDSTRLRVGELVLAVGNPLGLRGAATVGVVSGLGRRFGLPGRRGQEVIQADVALAPGNSGGPLLDVQGRVVGINALILSPGMALAVPSHVAQAFVSNEDGGVRLGISVQDVALSPALQARTGRARALLVADVVTGGPADLGGLLPGDLLLALEGQPVATTDDLLDRLAEQRPGVALRVATLRGGRLRTVVVLPVRA